MAKYREEEITTVHGFVRLVDKGKELAEKSGNDSEYDTIIMS